MKKNIFYTNVCNDDDDDDNDDNICFHDVNFEMIKKKIKKKKKKS